MSYTWLELGAYFLLYSALGWVAETLYYAVRRRGFYNRGLLTLPFLPSYGLSFVILLVALPELSSTPLLQFLLCLVVASVGEALSSHLLRRLARPLGLEPQRSELFSGSLRGLGTAAVMGGMFYLTYLVLHPLLMALVLLLPELLLRILVYVLLALLALDFLSVAVSVRTGRLSPRQRPAGRPTPAQRLSEAVWRRLQRAYPGIREAQGEELTKGYPFARGLCLDKLIWVFLISALLGDGIETLFCGLVNGQWMSRSSVLYGPFSFVWGLGAVVLTVTLRPLAEKNDRYVFWGGFVIGGAYEYLCSVFTELVFGTVFWDYSDMPLNIGGRTNVLFCFFWGVLAVVWTKLLYPPLSRAIEKLPALAGKVLTWVVVFFMICNALLTSAAMLRYDSRAARPDSANLFEEFLDRQYGDAMMEARWPNMVRSSPGEE